MLHTSTGGRIYCLPKKWGWRAPMSHVSHVFISSIRCLKRNLRLLSILAAFRTSYRPFCLNKRPATNWVRLIATSAYLIYLCSCRIFCHNFVYRSVVRPQCFVLQIRAAFDALHWNQQLILLSETPVLDFKLGCSFWWCFNSCLYLRTYCLLYFRYMFELLGWFCCSLDSLDMIAKIARFTFSIWPWPYMYISLYLTP